MRRLAGLVAVVFLLAGCGGGSTPTGAKGAAITARQLERQLAQQVHDRDHGSRYTGVHCVPRDKTTFECAGRYTPSRAAAKDAMAGIDTTGFTGADWEAIRKQRTGQVSYEVTVDPADGSWVSQPR